MNHSAPESLPEWHHSAKPAWLGSFSELWAYRHLLLRLIRRDFLLNYQQTILGPLWVLFQPIATLLTYVLVFSRLVGISTGSISPILFYLAGIILWGLFSETFIGNAFILRDNASVFSKVYFPRLITPLASAGTHLLRFGIQFGIFLLVLVGFRLAGWHTTTVTVSMLYIFPVVLIVSFLGLSLGLLFSILTAKYRDLSNLVHLGVRLLMFLCPVIYPLSIIPPEYKKFILWNPLTPCLETFRWAILGDGFFSPTALLYSATVALLALAGTLLWYNRTSSKLLDVV